MDVKSTKKVQPKEEPKLPRYVALDYGLSGASQFPSTPQKAQELWADLLNKKAEEGLSFRAVFSYHLGAEHNRKMIIFERDVN